jgi:hypothetical protein
MHYNAYSLEDMYVITHTDRRTCSSFANIIVMELHDPGSRSRSQLADAADVVLHYDVKYFSPRMVDVARHIKEHGGV